MMERTPPPEGNTVVDSDESTGLLDNMLFIRPQLEEATVSPWRRIPVAAVPQPLALAEQILGDFFLGVAIDGDEDTRGIHIHARGGLDIRISGEPGGDITLQGEPVGGEIAAWLLDVRERYWHYTPIFDTVIHGDGESLLTGTGHLARDEEPHLFSPAFDVAEVGWVNSDAQLHCAEAKDIERQGSRVFQALEVDAEGSHSLVGLLIITDDGIVTAMPTDPLPADQEQEVTQALLRLGARRFAADIMHNHLHGMASLCILGLDIGRVFNGSARS